MYRIIAAAAIAASTLAVATPAMASGGPGTTQVSFEIYPADISVANYYRGICPGAILHVVRSGNTIVTSVA